MNQRQTIERPLAVMLFALLTIASNVMFRPSAAGAASAIPATSSLVSLTPCRLLDTRGSAPSTTVAVDPRGRCGVPSSATSLSIVITVADASAAPGYLMAWSGEGIRPEVSNLNWTTVHETRANSTLVRLSTSGEFVIELSVASHVLVDVTAAWVPTTSATAGRFIAVNPSRILDTRSFIDAPEAGSSVFVTTPADIPADATALAVNITMVDTAGAGYLSAYPHGSMPTDSSIVNVDAPGQTRATGVIVRIDQGGFDVFTSVRSNIVVDVTGWFTGDSATDSPTGLLVAIDGRRILDTRQGGVIHDNGSVSAPLDSVFDSASAVLVTVTMVDNADTGWVAVYPAGNTQPASSTVNGSDVRGATANTAIVGVGTNGLIVHSSVRTQVLIDLLGWFSGSPIAMSGAATTLVNEPRVMPDIPPCDSYPTGRAAIVDRVTQVAWLCRDGRAASGYMPFTAGPIEDAPKGEYRVFFKRHPWHGGGYDLQRFTAFTRGNEGGRVAFHRFVEMPETAVGSEEYRNQSSGCLRMRTSDAITIWNFLQVGDRVRVLNNA